MAGARIRKTTNTSVPSGVTTSLSFNISDYADSGTWASGSPNKLTAPATAWYTIIGQASLSGPLGGTIRQLILRKNGSTVLADMCASDQDISSGDQTLVVSTVEPLVTGDYIELLLYQDSEANMNVAATTYSPVLSFTSHPVD